MGPVAIDKSVLISSPLFICKSFQFLSRVHMYTNCRQLHAWHSCAAKVQGKNYTMVIHCYSCKNNDVLKSNNRGGYLSFWAWSAEIRYCIEEPSENRVIIDLIRIVLDRSRGEGQRSARAWNEPRSRQTASANRQKYVACFEGLNWFVAVSWKKERM